MPTPHVSPANPGQGTYQVTGSKRFIAGFHLAINPFTTEDFTLIYPSTVTPKVTLTRLDPGSAHPRSPVDLMTTPPTGTVDDFTFDVTITDVSATQKKLTCHVNNQLLGDNGLGNKSWELRADFGAAVEADFGGFDPFALVVNWLATDPVAALVPTTPATAIEQATVTLTARDAKDGTTFGTLPGDLDTTSYTFTHSGLIGITDLPGSGPTHDIVLPGVYQPVPVPLTVTTTFGTGPVYGGFLSDVGDPFTLTISARPQRLVVVLDRSFSMNEESRWDNAKIAANLLVHLFAGARDGVNDDDRVAIVVFEDEPGVFRPDSPSKLIQAVLPLSGLVQAKAKLKDPNFSLGDPGSNTPIGDGLVAAIDLLAAPDAPANSRNTIILLSDGEENAGTVYIDPQSVGNFDKVKAVDSGARSFAEVTSGALFPTRRAVLDATRLYTVALGPTANQNLFSKLAATASYKLVTNAAELSTIFGHMLGTSQEINPITAQATPTGGHGDPDTPVPAAYFVTSPTDQRLLVGVTPAPNHTTISDTVQLAKWTGAAYEGQPVTVEGKDFDRFVSFDLTTIPHDTSIDWRVINGATPASAQPLIISQVLPYADLHLKADVLLDKAAYGTGDRMVLTVRIRQDAGPVLGAKVRAVLDAPAVGLGASLAGLGEVKASLRTGPDTPTGVAGMIDALLAKNSWHDMPRTKPKPGLFVDHTDQLFDRDGDGNYTNTFAKVFKEGTYTWQLFIEGKDATGNPFTRNLHIATFVTVKVSPKATKVEVTRIPDHPSGLLAANVVITPQDARGELLGPNKDDQVFWALRDGTFEYVRDQKPAPVFTDGTYQRVVLFSGRQRPELRVAVAGVLLREIDVDRSLHGLVSSSDAAAE